MAFQVFTERTNSHRSSAWLESEVSAMLTELQKKPGQSALIDIDSVTVKKYADKLGIDIAATAVPRGNGRWKSIVRLRADSATKSDGEEQ